MRPSPFSDLKLTGVPEQQTVGSDQRLFAPTPVPHDGGAGVPTSEETTNVPSRPRLSVPPSEGTRPRANATVPDTSHEQSSVRASGNPRETTPARALPRGVARHSHDIFQDQIRWLNRLKLELSERYDVPVTGNAIVQLAVDMLREDYVRKGEQSRLIRVLIDGLPWPSTAPSTRQVGTEEGAT